jgi:hypothetical protein
MNPSFWRKLTWMEWLIAGLITLVAALLHGIFLECAGPLWRDEIGIVNIALLPAWSDVWNTLPHDHCPIIFPSLARLWSESGLGATDYGLRIFGVGIGLCLLATFWIANRMMGRGLPLFSLALVAMNVTVITFGDSLRAYGLATVFIVLTLGMVWRFLERPDWRRGLLAGIAAVASVHTLYQNAFLLLAICLAGMTVSLCRRQYRVATAVLGIGLVGALSLAPYIKPMIEAQSWWEVSKTGDGFLDFLDRLIQITGGFSSKWFLGVWFVLVLIAAVLGIAPFLMAVDKKGPGRQDVSLFAGVALISGFVGYGLFFKLAGLPVQPWYCIPLLGFMAVCCDVILPRIHPAMRPVMLLVAIISVLLAFPVTYAKVQQRRSNGDWIVEKLAHNIRSDDFVIVHPWYYGLTFARYYNGHQDWTTLPPLGDYRFHRYDLIKPKLQMTNAIQPVLEKVEATLRAGHRVWIVGDVPFSKPNAAPPVDLAPAPNGPEGWLDSPYTRAWGLKLGYLLGVHATNVTPVIDSSAYGRKPWENIGLTVISGWQNAPPTNSAAK